MKKVAHKYNEWKKRKKALDLLKKHKNQIYEHYIATKKIDLMDEGLNKFPEYILGLRNIKSINIMYNNMDDLPIEKLKKCYPMNVIHTYETYIPNSIKEKAIKEGININNEA